MTTELTSRSQSAKHPAVLKLMGGAPFSQRMQQVYDTLPVVLTNCSRAADVRTATIWRIGSAQSPSC